MIVAHTNRNTLASHNDFEAEQHKSSEKQTSVRGYGRLTYVIEISKRLTGANRLYDYNDHDDDQFLFFSF